MVLVADYRHNSYFVGSIKNEVYELAGKADKREKGESKR